MSSATTFPCESCGSGVPAGQLHCGTCGAAVTARRTCPACSETVLAVDRFCPSCGHSLSGTSGFTQPAPPPSPWDAVLRRLQAATLGEFEIKRELGRGGMAAVYLAHDIALDLKVAIKVMAPGVMMGEGMIDRFRLEAVTVAKLSHPNIVRVHALRQAAEDLHFIVMQYVPGRTLERVVRETGPLPIPVVRTVLSQVGRALAYAHKRGVVHRDVKPGNIMLDATGDVVVTDFGIAKVATAPSHTLTGSVVGTPAYMSPEQCLAQPLTGASDQYSLGVVAFEMLTGQVPFSGASYTVMHGHTHGEVPSIRSVRGDCPADLEATVARMLAKTPEGRFASIGEAAAAAGAPLLADHDPLRDELIRLAAVEESMVLDAMYPTPMSPVPATRASVPRVTSPVTASQTPVPPAPAPQVSIPLVSPPKAATPGAAATPVTPLHRPVVDVRTIVDPALLAASRAGTAAATAAPPPVRPIGSRSRQTVLGAVAVVLVVAAAAGLLVTRPWADDDPIVVDPPPPPLSQSGGGSGTSPAAVLRIGGVPLTVAVGDTFTLGVIFQGPDTLATVPNEWRSRAPAVLRVDASGRATALREGNAVVSLRRGALVDSVALRVLPGAVRAPVNRLVIAPPASPVRVSDQVRLRIDEIDASGRRRPPAGRVTWSSANPTVAFVDPTTGALVARAAGRTVITARTATGQATISVAVDPPPPPPTNPDPVQPKQDPIVTPPPPPPSQPDPGERTPPTKSAAELRAELDEAVRTYARAIEAEDLGRVRSLYPGITPTQLDGFRKFFEAARDIRLTIERIDAPQLSAAPGSAARVRVEYAIEYYNTSVRRSARESARWDATLERTATGWRMLSIR